MNARRCVECGERQRDNLERDSNTNDRASGFRNKGELKVEILDSSQRTEYVRRITELTDLRRIEWTSTHDNPKFSFFAFLPTTSLIIGSADNDDAHPISLEVYLGQGREDHFLTLSSDLDEREFNGYLLKLYRLAKSMALRIDESAKQLFQDLDRLE